MTMQRRQVGLAGEKAALHHLQKKGYRIEQVNYRCTLGEIDIVARDGPAVIFVEVRTRTGGAFGGPEESITAAKEKRLKKLALHYMQFRYGRDVPCRFDLVAVIIGRGSLAVKSLHHYCGIFAG